MHQSPTADSGWTDRDRFWYGTPQHSRGATPDIEFARYGPRCRELPEPTHAFEPVSGVDYVPE